jgi:imidazolonepropionase-like amidohydrolase
MRTAGGIEVNTDLNIKNMIDQGKLLGPSIDVSTPLIERAGTLDATVPQLPSLYPDESIENWLNYWFDKGVTSVKVYNNITKDDLRKILEFSHAKKIKVTGHLCSITYSEAAEMGIDNLEHGFNVATDFVADKLENKCVNSKQSLMNLDENDPRLISLMKLLIEKGVTLTYTPNIHEPNTNREVIPGGGEEALAPHLLKHFKSSHDKAVNTQGDSLKLIAFKKEMKRIKKFHSLNGKLIVGTDPTGSGKTIPGYANQRLIELLVETGFSIEEAIKLSTLNGALYMGIEKETGSIEVGKNVDLVLIDGDLSEKISNIRKMEIVFKNGIGYDSQKIFNSVKGKVGL